METSSSSLKSNVFYPPVNQDAVKVLVDFIKQETGRFGIKKCVIGLSGGVDSAAAAYLTEKALGKKNLTALLLPYKSSSKDSIKDALVVAKKLDIKTRIINLTPAVDAFIGEEKMDKIRKGNIIARMRMIALYDYSSIIKGLVIGTGNKTEILLGYTTLYGDSAYAINPIGDLYKTQVWQLAKVLKIPDKLIRKKPSADLWTGQTDEGELGFTYRQVDKLLYYMIDCKFSDEELIEAGFKPTFIEKVRSIIRKNQFKRLPPIIAKLSTRTVNVDFRYNRDWGT